VEKIIGAGIDAVWNFTNVKLKVPSRVIVQQEDLSSGYAVLCVKMGIHES
jgi:redox-sensing transcriptional repressor